MHGDNLSQQLLLNGHSVTDFVPIGTHNDFSPILERCMEYICKYCGKTKGDATGWLLGFEGVPGAKVMKGAVSLLGLWDEQRANEPTAIHFCSRACQTRYLVENYGDDSWAA